MMPLDPTDLVPTAAPAAAPASFLWGASGQKVDPLEARRAVANALITKGTSMAPVQHWTQGLDRAASALMGGYDARQIDRARAQPLAPTQSVTPPMAASSTSFDVNQNNDGGLFGLAGALNPWTWGQ